jgi:hypothetical protein
MPVPRDRQLARFLPGFGDFSDDLFKFKQWSVGASTNLFYSSQIFKSNPDQRYLIKYLHFVQLGFNFGYETNLPCQVLLKDIITTSSSAIVRKTTNMMAG